VILHKNLKNDLLFPKFYLLFVVKYKPAKIKVDATITVALKTSDLEYIAYVTPITGCKYTKTATSLDFNLVKAYPFKK
jgi:hypothetical protein